MPLKIILVENKKDFDRFIRIPWRLYAEDPCWVPPLMMERRDHLNVRKNPFFEHAKACFLIALRGDVPVGRISAQVDYASLEKHHDGAGYFGFLEAEDDIEVFQALFHAAEKWLKSQGMKKVRGPFSLSINDEAGLLVKGYDSPPSLMMGHAFPYYAKHVEACGYSKAQDLIAYDFDLDKDGLPERSRAIADRFIAKPNVTIRGLDKSKYLEEVGVILDIFNDAWADNWGFVPLTPAEIKKTADDLKPLVIPEHVCIIEMDGTPVAFGLTLPNLNEAIADLDGKLLPFGWAKLLYRLKFNKLKSLRLPLLGIRKPYQRSWLGAAMSFVIIDTLNKSNKAYGRKSGELSWVLDDNYGMRKIIESTGCRVYKTYRIYEKSLV